MDYQKELDFLLKFFKNYPINTCFYTDKTEIASIDFHLRDSLGLSFEYRLFQHLMLSNAQSPTIYKIADQFYCIYYLIPLTTDGNYSTLIIGPYIQAPLDKLTLQKCLEAYHITPQLLQHFQHLFSQIPVVLDDTAIQTLIQTFGETLWKQDFRFEILDKDFKTSYYGMMPSALSEETLPFLDSSLTESYFKQENNLIQAVSQGKSLKAEEFLTTIYPYLHIEHTPDSLQNIKNYAITLNTLLRKTCELSLNNVIPVVTIYFRFSQKIEETSSTESCIILLREMVRKYSLLIKNASMKQYSELVQQVIYHLDVDLTADLSLHTMAKTLNVNASYLSTHFKAVTGTAYTDYVNRKRIDHSLYLLNTTSLQIQTIAQYCGIPDLNYFTKLFKKYIHSTPSAYRKLLAQSQN